MHWETQAVPLMKAIYSHQETCPNADSHLPPEYSQLEGTERRQLDRNLDLLRREGFIDFEGITTAEGGYHAIYELRILGAGLRALEEWPSDDPLERILADVTALEATTRDSARKAKLGSLREFVLELASRTAAHAVT
jgi:hypothetical protein